jgi:hypothetical protein
VKCWLDLLCGKERKERLVCRRDWDWSYGWLFWKGVGYS